jgi:hypothetical protein
MPYLAMAYLLSGDKKYLEKAEKWALAACSYPTWGKSLGGFTDLPAGHLNFGLAITYDWLFNDLSDTTKKTILDTLTTRGTALYNALKDETTVDTWNKAYLQNHLWVKATGLAAASLAIRNDYSRPTLGKASTPRTHVE